MNVQKVLDEGAKLEDAFLTQQAQVQKMAKVFRQTKAAYQSWSAQYAPLRKALAEMAENERRTK